MHCASRPLSIDGIIRPSASGGRKFATFKVKVKYLKFQFGAERRTVASDDDDYYDYDDDDDNNNNNRPIPVTETSWHLPVPMYQSIGLLNGQSGFIFHNNLHESASLHSTDQFFIIISIYLGVLRFLKIS